MHRQCLRLTETNPVLKGRYEASEFKELYLRVTIDDRESDAEFDAAFESRRAWRFGRIG